MEQAREAGLVVDEIDEYRVVHLAGDLDANEVGQIVDRYVVDPVDGWWVHRDDHEVPEGSILIETGVRPGVTDREAAELARVGSADGLRVRAAALGRRWIVRGAEDPTALAERVLHNDVVERHAFGPLPAAFTDPDATAPETITIDIGGLDDDALADLGRQRRLGLDELELSTIRSHFAFLGREATDAELEMLAQTWSEHCQHTTFRAEITIDDPSGERDGEVVDGLLKQFLRAATDTIAAPWVTSAFVDNAGLIEFEPGWDLAIKAETHNHPSALEPFGGANTGVGGVVRDILGVSARPIAVTDILCFGPTDTPADEVPDGVLHPRRIRAGVIDGVGDYGNKIGVPNIAGAIVHDPGYITTPLVFAGCLGVLPSGSHPTDAAPGDAIVVLGGAVGRDGVGGATFSSQTMGVETALVAGSSVQIGDPIVEKGLIDVVVAARDAGLYSAITDCGAGGLSSSVGEMGAELGCDVQLDDVPRKYPGLAPWEVWLSEAQERMVLACPDPAPVLALAERWAVDAAVIGTFSGDGRIVVRDGDETLIDLDAGFLHDGAPRRRLHATRPDRRRDPREPETFDAKTVLLDLLSHPSLRSNEDVVRTFDHEVLGGTVVRPYGGPEADGPADGTSVVPVGTSGERAAVIGIGVNARYGPIDPEAMAWAVIDEAIRNAVVAGADPDRIALLDNFSWGDPTDAATLGGLVEACRGCHDAAVHHGAPFVSGKDSLFNVYVMPDGTPDPVVPTLVITALGINSRPDRTPATGAVASGHDIWLVGPAAGALGGSHFDAVTGGDRGGAVPAPDRDARRRHRGVADAIAAGVVVSAHDLAEGGLAVAAAEWAHAGRIGVAIDIPGLRHPEIAFGEGPGRYLLEVRPDDAAVVGGLLPDAVRVGVTEPNGMLRLTDDGDPVVSVELDEIRLAYAGHVTAGAIA